jgi:hypothetical protein
LVRGKFRVIEIADTCYGQKKVILSPEYDTSIEEDRRYSKATPSGTITMMIDNPPAVEYLKLGGYFYVDFTAAPQLQQAKAG